MLIFYQEYERVLTSSIVALQQHNKPKIVIQRAKEKEEQVDECVS